MDAEDRRAHDEIIGEAWASMLEVCPPKRCPPKPTNVTRVMRVIAVADSLGMELMPHQICVVATLTEAADDSEPDGRRKYQEALVMMARQSGKSAALQVLACERVLATPYQRWLWGAQRLESAILQIEQETWPTIQELGLDEKLGVRLKKGAGPQLGCQDSGSSLALRSTGAEDSMRGQAYDGLILDELYSIEDFEADAALKPTLITKYETGAAVWLASTAPKEKSVYLEAKMASHEKFANTKESRKAYWLWAADEDCNPSDPEVWRRCIPGLAFGLIKEEDVRAEYEEMTLDLFKREYLTIPAPTSKAETFVPKPVWKEVEASKDSKVEVLMPVWLGIDAAPDQTRAAVVACDQSGVLELVRQDNKVGWVADVVEDLWGSGHATGVCVLSPGPLKHLLPRLRTFGEQYKVRNAEGKLVVPVLALPPHGNAEASQLFLQAVLDRSVHVVFSAGVFSEANSQSRRRKVGETGGFTIARADEETECSALVAAALAYYAATAEGWQYAIEEAKKGRSVDALTAWGDSLASEDIRDPDYWGD